MPEINQHGQTVNDIVPDWKCARDLNPHPAHRAAIADWSRWMLTAIRLICLKPTRWVTTATGRGLPAPSLQALRPLRTGCWERCMDDDLVPFAVIDLRTEQAVGLVSYMAIERAFRARLRSATSPGRAE